jgi:hypothetical protein
MLDSIIKSILGEFRTIANAPTSFVTALVAGFVLIWLGLDWRYAGIISNKDSEITLIKSQRDDYHDKLGGASPDQAKAKLDALEKKVAEIDRAIVRPRRLSEQQKEQIAGSIRGTAARIAIEHEGSCFDCPRFAADLALALRGWRISEGMGFGPGNRPATGLRVSARDFDSPPVLALLAGLRRADVRFEIMQIPSVQNIDIELFVTSGP